MQGLARHLQNGAHQALQEGRGLLVELYALQLGACLSAEAAGDPGTAPLLGVVQQQCSDLLSQADATAEAAEDRYADVETMRVWCLLPR
jgi:hypothetical protein